MKRLDTNDVFVKGEIYSWRNKFHDNPPDESGSHLAGQPAFEFARGFFFARGSSMEEAEILAEFVCESF